MEYLIGLASGLVLFVLMGASFYAGTRYNKPAHQTVSPPSEEERRKAEQMKKGFDEMMSYSMEKARGTQN
jgi:hypothetical protein